MSQNAILDRETVVSPIGSTSFAEGMTERLPIARAQREHLMLLDWELGATQVAPAAQELTPVRPVRRPWFGWYEACILLLLGGSGVAAAVSLLHLG